jgi:hypothetical protein
MMAKNSLEPTSIFVAAPLTVEQLEAGLAQLDQGAIATDDFWGENLAAFRDTIVVAIGESSAMLAGRMPYRQRRELEVQVKALRRYVTIVDSCIARRGAKAKPRLN